MTYKSAKALLKRKNISTGALEWLIDRLHVSTSDEDVAADIRKRINGKEPENVTQAAIAIALHRHHDNQGTYRFVTRGIA